MFDGKLSYGGLHAALAENRIAFTIETFPEHGKYHLDGHRNCGVRLEPLESAVLDGRCPVCNRLLTIGVAARVAELSDASRTAGDGAPAFLAALPLDEIIGAVRGVSARSRTVQRTVDALVAALGPELDILVSRSGSDVATIAGDDVAAALLAVREGRVAVDPGFDGQYGRLLLAPLT